MAACSAGLILLAVSFGPERHSAHFEGPSILKCLDRKPTQPEIIQRKTRLSKRVSFQRRRERLCRLIGMWLRLSTMRRRMLHTSKAHEADVMDPDIFVDAV
jgi:hypothetical protein